MYKNGFGIKQPTMVDMTSNQTKPKPLMGPLQVLLHQFRVDLGVMQYKSALNLPNKNFTIRCLVSYQGNPFFVGET